MTKIIAEVKTKSPFGFKSDYSWDELFETANQIGDWISIHTDKRWGGSFDLLKRARKQTNKFLLAKGIHPTDDDIKKAFGMGADYVLVVGRFPYFKLDPGGDYEKTYLSCLIEVNTLGELKYLPPNAKAVWNIRSLENGMSKLETFEQAREIHTGWLCQASFIKTPEDINPKADAAIIGTHLMEFAKYVDP